MGKEQKRERERGGKEEKMVSPPKYFHCGNDLILSFNDACVGKIM